jgi:hypothetical protein
VGLLRPRIAILGCPRSRRFCETWVSEHEVLASTGRQDYCAAGFFGAMAGAIILGFQKSGSAFIHDSPG